MANPTVAMDDGSCRDVSRTIAGAPKTGRWPCDGQPSPNPVGFGALTRYACGIPPASDESHDQSRRRRDRKSALMKMHQTIKDALDPNGILSPGKSGIWPKRLREDTKA